MASSEATRPLKPDFGYLGDSSSRQRALAKVESDELHNFSAQSHVRTSLTSPSVSLS
jgi:GDP-D-mannose dehydratase